MIDTNRCPSDQRREHAKETGLRSVGMNDRWTFSGKDSKEAPNSPNIPQRSYPSLHWNRPDTDSLLITKLL